MARLEQLIIEPSAEYYPVPWWSWTGGLDPKLLRRQLDLMREQGIREFFIFPLYGLDVEYMSDEYLDRIEQVCQWCKDLGMRVWIYDEHNWPSGMAGGLVPRGHPEAIGWSVRTERTADPRPDASVIHAVRVSGDGVPEPVLVGGLGSSKGDFVLYRLTRDSTPNITSCGSIWCRREPGMLDLMSESACRAFIVEAYEPIYRRCGRFFGSTIKGFFTDEPTMPPGPIPWTPELPQRFKACYGYDLVPVLHNLTFITPTSDRTRADYWSLVSELSAEAFTGQIAKWCEDHGVVLTGHTSMEECSISVWPHGDTPTHLKKMQLPGCDMLGLFTGFDGETPWGRMPGRTLAPRVASSSARAVGRKRVMCEAYGIAPWTRTMAEEKRLTDWLVALGINLINDNGLITDISRFRKRGLAGKHFTQPWWPDARMQYDYAAGLSSFCAETTLDARIAVLYPTTTWWTLTQREGDRTPELAALESAFHRTLDALVRTHWDFEFLFEDALADAKIENGALVTRYGSFHAVVAAGIARLGPRAARRLEEFSKEGGLILLVGSKIESVESAANRRLDLATAVNVNCAEDKDLRSSLGSLLVEEIERVWEIRGEQAGDVISAARIDDSGRQALLIANMTPVDKRLEIAWHGDWSVTLLDAASRRQWLPQQSNGSLGFVLPDGESMVVLQGTGEGVSNGVPAHFWDPQDAPLVIDLPGSWRFETDRPNLFRLRCRVKPDSDGSLSPDSLGDDDWLETDWGDCGTPLSPDTCRAYWMIAEFDVQATIPDLSVVVDSDDTLEAYLNGTLLPGPKSVTVWEETNLSWALNDVRIGRSTILLKVRPSVYHSDSVIGITPGTGLVSHAPIRSSMTEPVVLRGTFGVSESGDVPVLTHMPTHLSAGDWNSQGFPHFAGTGTYSAEFDWNGPEGTAVLACEAGKDVVEALLDGDSLGKRAWGRRWFEISHLARGPHVAQVKITNTLGSILRRTYDAMKYPGQFSGLMSPPSVILKDAAP